MSKDERETPRRSADDRLAFKRELTGVIPHLRAFARGLCGRPDMADDLVQETLLKAWAAQDRFEPGTSMRAWTFVILRNAYLTDMRRNRFRGRVLLRGGGTNLRLRGRHDQEPRGPRARGVDGDDRRRHDPRALDRRPGGARRDPRGA